MISSHRSHALWYAYLLHRISGLALALFLPLHFYALSLALTEPERLDDMLIWSRQPIVKASEFVLIFLLAVHFFGGLRLLALEFLPWSPKQKTYAAAATALAFFVSCTFLMNAI